MLTDLSIFSCLFQFTRHLLFIFWSYACAIVCTFVANSESVLVI